MIEFVDTEIGGKVVSIPIIHPNEHPSRAELLAYIAVLESSIQGISKILIEAANTRTKKGRTKINFARAQELFGLAILSRPHGMAL